jgi:hypothetical protein
MMLKKQSQRTDRVSSKSRRFLTYLQINRSSLKYRVARRLCCPRSLRAVA